MWLCWSFSNMYILWIFFIVIQFNDQIYGLSKVIEPWLLWKYWKKQSFLIKVKARSVYHHILNQVGRQASHFFLPSSLQNLASKSTSTFPLFHICLIFLLKWVRNKMFFKINLLYTLCWRFFHPKQKMPKDLSILLSKLVIGDLESVEKYHSSTAPFRCY